MARWVKRLLLLVVGLATAATLVALVMVKRFIDPDRLAGYLTQRVRATTGREFAVTGGLRVRILPRIAVVAGDVRLGNVSWGSRPDMLQVRRVEGSIPLLPLLRGEIQVDELVFVEPTIFLESDPAGAANWEFDRPASAAPQVPSDPAAGSPLTLVLKAIAVEGGSLVRRSGATGEEVRLSLDRLTLKRPASSTKNDLDLTGALDDRPFTLTGQVSPLEAFLTRGDPLGVDLALATEGATATLAGKIDRGGSGPLVEGMLKVRVADTQGRTKKEGRPVSTPIPLDLSGKLTVGKNTYRLDGVEIAHGAGTASGNLLLRLDTPQPDLTADFSATWRTGDAAKEVKLSVDSLTLKRNPSTTTNALECAGLLQEQPFSLTGLTGPVAPFLAGRNPLALDLALAMEGAKATFSGKIERSDDGLLADANVKVHIGGTAVLAKLAGGPVTIPLPLDLAGRFAVNEKTWRLDGLTIAAGQSTVSGDLALRLGTPAPELTAALSAAWRSGESGSEVRLTLNRLTLKRNAGSATDSLDLAGSLRGQPFTLTGQVGALEKFFSGRDPLAVDLAFATEGATATLAGKLVKDDSGPLPDGAVKVHIGGTPGLSKLAGRPVNLPVPLDLTGILAVKGKTWRMDRLEIASGRSTASGSLVVLLDTARPHVSAVVDAPLIDLPELAGWNHDDGEGVKVRGRRLFADAPLPFDMLRGFDGRLKLKAARLVLAGWLQLESAFLDLDLRNSLLKIDPLGFTVGGGSVAGSATVDATPARTPRVAARLDGRGISLERLATDAGHTGSIVGGSADLSVDLSGSGTSVRSLMSGLTGELRLSSGPARLAFLALPPGDVLTGLFTTMNPFRKKDEYTDLTCAVVRLPVRNGLVTIDRTVAYETAQVATSVAGTISLDSEALDLAIRPAVKSGFGMAGAPSTAEFARIKGTLTSPGIELNTLTSARAALSAGGAVATGGLSLLGEAFFKKTTADYHPCRTALEKEIAGK